MILTLLPLALKYCLEGRVQKAETSTLDAQTEVAKSKVTDLVKIAVDEAGKIYVNWPVDKKELVIGALAEAIKLVATYQTVAPVIHKPSIMDFVKGIKR